ncbi:MAG: hypothetical protein IT223_04280, partial [Crocinitomicaceae bacterium]|nr:hypothetical protein [Crocinitomicaceae bacterium]
MIYLLLSILTSSAIFLLFKWFGKKNIHVFEAIVANYVVALAIGIVVVDDLPEAMHSAMEFPSWFIAALCLGAVFIGMFYLMALASQKMGVASTSIASKMSLALTVLLIALSDPDEHVGFLRVVIILMALAGVVLSSYRKGEKMIETKFIGWSLLILVISTVIDFSLAHFSKMPVTESELQLFSCVPFFTAAVIGLTVVVRHFFTAGYRMRPKDFFSGILLGIV